TTFLLIPVIGSRAITLSLGAAGLACGLLLVALPRLERARSLAAILVAATVAMPMLGILTPRAEDLVNESVRAAMLKRADGRIAHVESQYNDIYITKRRGELVMAFQLRGWDYTESVANLGDPDDLPLRYAQVMSIATIYPEEPKKILMLGLGG